MKQWQCNTCFDIQKSSEKPEFCLNCGASSTGLILYKESSPPDERVDVIVIGSGAAALSAAVTATQEGAKVILLEKSDTLGGTTRRSGGRYWIPNNYVMTENNISDSKEDAMAYMCRYSYPNKYNASLTHFGLSEYEYQMIENFYDNGSVMLDYFRDNHVFDSQMDMNWLGKPHVDYLQNVKENNNIRGRSIYAIPKKENASPSGGVTLIDNFLLWLNEKNADIRTEHQVIKVISNENKEIIGVTAITPQGIQNFYANNGVIFATGGFSQNKDLIKRFHAHDLVGGCAVPENTGDLVPIAESIGAMLGNMTNAFRVQSLYEVYLENPAIPSSTFFFIGDSFLEVNKYGKRVVNEKRNYNDRTLIHYAWDPIKAEYPNQFLFFVTDQRAVDYWGGFPPYPQGSIEDNKHVIVGETLDELSDNIEKRLDHISNDIGEFQLSSDFKANLKETIWRFNKFAENGKDLDFLRGETDYEKEYPTMPPFNPDIIWPDPESKNITMFPLSEKGPYYAIILSPGSLDTNGGPMINQFGQLLKNGYIPIKGIYGAGNCIASPEINAYWGAGATIGPAMTYGYLSVMHALEKLPKK